MADTQVIRVRRPPGTDIPLPIAGRRPLRAPDCFTRTGQSGNLPTGEAYLAPLEGQSNGVVVVDGSMAGIGVMSQPIRIFVEGRLRHRHQRRAGSGQLVALLEPHGRDGRNVAEFGIGTNDRAS